MGQRLLTYTLLLSLVLQLFSREVIVMSFTLNRDYIAKTLCENRDRPALNCNGQCYLAKKLKAQHDREDRETTERIQNLPTIALICEEWCSFSFADASVETQDLSSLRSWTYLHPPYAAHLTGVFQPPRLA